MFKAGKRYFKSSEDLVSMLLGLAIMVVVVSLVFNFIQRKKGTVEIPGANDITLSEDAIKQKQEEENFYTVVSGDNLWKIAEKRYKSGYVWTKIAKENNLKNASVLYVGQKLKMPIISDATISGSNTIVSADNAGTKINPGSDYKVVRGDNLWKIAVSAYGDGYKWVNIWNENKAIIPHADLLEIGMTIKIPKL